MKMRAALARSATYLVSATVLLVVWHFAARVVSSPLILPSPVETMDVLFRDIASASFWRHIGATSARSIVAFLVSILCGVLLGVLSGVSDVFRRLLEFPLAIVRATPVVSFILLALFWFGSSIVPVFVSVLMSLPVVVSSVDAGIRGADFRLLAMARSYGLSRMRVIRHVYLPSCVPSFLSGCRSAFGLSWKVVAAGEVLSLPRHAAGTLLHGAKVHLETAEVFAVTLVLVAICFTLEHMFHFVVRCVLDSGRFS